MHGTPPPILYKYLDAEGAIKTLGNLSLKFSSPLSLNDPFEGLYGDISDANKEEVHKMLLRAKYFKNEWARICETRLGISREKALVGFELVDFEDLRWFEYWFEQVYQVFVDTMHRCFGELRSDILVFKAITCFSANWNNLLMWGHYADKHRGCVIGFDTKKLSDQVGTPLQVKYPHNNHRVSMPTTVNTYNDSQRATETIITKPREWSYEEEWRIISKIADRNLSCNGGGLFRSFAPSVVREVIIGIRADDNLKQHMVKFWQMHESSCELYYASLHRCDFRIERKSFMGMVTDMAQGKGTPS